MPLGTLQTPAAPHFVSEMGDRRSLRASDWEEAVFEASQGLLSGSLSALKALVRPLALRRKWEASPAT